jgi:hypothetical protein
MALNPEILKALAGGSKVYSAFDVGAANQAAGSGGAKPSAWSIGQSIIDILSTGGYATAGIANKVGENVAAAQRGELGGVLDLLNPLSVFPAAAKGVAERRTYSENLRNLGVDKNTSTWLGLALDIGLDPTTYITGGTIAGIRGIGAGTRLASAANKSNSTIAKSALEAAEQNLPDLARPFIPSEAPLTQGQKMGNYLTGVLRGYEFNKATYAAERANRKAVGKLEKEIKKAEKAGDYSLTNYSKELLEDIHSATKVVDVNLADNAAAVSRQAFFDAISKSPTLQAKLGKRADKMVRLGAKADKVSFVDPKTAKKLDAEQASIAAKAAQLEDASNIDPVSATAPEAAIVADQPALTKQVEAELAAERIADSEKLAKLKKSNKKRLASVQTKYGEIANEALDFIAKTTDPDTGKRLSAALSESDNPLEAVAQLLSSGKLKPTVARLNRFAKVLGVPSDPQQSVVTLMSKALVTISKVTGRIIATDLEIERLGKQLPNGIESGFVTAKAENIPVASGAVNGVKAGRIAEGAVGLEQEIPARLADVFDEAYGTSVGGAPRGDQAIAESVAGLRVGTANELIEDLDQITALLGTSTRPNQIIVLQDYLASGPLKQLQVLAKGRGTTVDEELAKIIESYQTGEPIEELTKGIIRLDVINPEARIAAYDKVWTRLRKNEGKGNRTPARMVEEQGRILRSFDNLWRTLNVPVRTQENALMQLRRDGAKMVGDKLSDDFVPLSGDFTVADIGLLAVRKGAADLMGALQWPGKAYQNVMPTNFEYAALTAMRFKGLGSEIKPGTEAWNEIEKAFNQKYEFGEAEGLVPKKVSVEEFFVPAAHVNPTKVVGDRKLKQIPDLEERTQEMIQFIVDNVDELENISAARAAARIAQNNATVLPSAMEVVADMIRFAAFRQEFIEAMPRLAARPDALSGALENGVGKLVGLAPVKYTLKKVIKSVAQSSKALPDPLEAQASLDLMINMMFKSLVGGVSRGPLADLPREIREPATSYITSEMSRLRRDIRTELKIFEYVGSTKPSAQVSEKAVEQGMNARRVQEEIASAEIEGLVPLGKANKDQAAVEMFEAGVKATDEKGNLPHNHAEMFDDDFLTGKANALQSELKEITDTKFSEKWLRAFSGSHGVGSDLKTVISGVEYINYSKPQMFNNTLKRIFIKYNKDIPKINAGFKLLQGWGREMVQRIEVGEAEIPFREWVKDADVDAVEADIGSTFSDGIAAIFGADGVMTDSVNHKFFGEELNKMFGMQKMINGEDLPLRLPDKAGPMAIKYSWADAKIGDKATSLTLLAEYVNALHSVQTRIGIGASFSRHFGKTLKQIKEEGLTESDFIKVDPKDEFARYLDNNKLYDAVEWEKLRYLKQYVLYPRSFSSKNVQRVVDFSDMITTVLKGLHTTWRPGHHVTSVIGNSFMNSFAGVNSPKYYSNAFEILRAFDPSVYKGDDNMFMAYARVGTPKGMDLNTVKYGRVGYIDAKTGKRTVLTNEMVAALAEQLSVLVRAGMGNVEDLNLTGLGGLAGGAKGTISRINYGLATFSSHRDNIFRMALFIKEIEKGGVFNSALEAAVHAAKVVAKYHPTVGGLSAFERKYMRRAVFFYTWQRIAATRVFALMLEQPGKVTIPSKIQYAFAEANGFNPESFGDPWDPDGVYASWHTGSLYGPQFQGPSGEGDAWGFGPAVPQLDIMNSLLGGYDVQPGQSGFDVLLEGTQNLAGQNLSPLPKWFAELSTGNRVGTGGNINNYLEYAIDQVGGLNTLSKITGIGQDPETGLTPTEQGERKTRLLMNWFLGQRLQDYSTSQTMKQWRNDQRLQMQRLLGDTGR